MQTLRATGKDNQEVNLTPLLATLDPALHAESPVRLGQRLALRE